MISCYQMSTSFTGEYITKFKRRNKETVHSQ
nr:MAG TPA: hypothetical protein [Caudoviricetes sp.]